jgi:type VI secretion system protein ImpG
MQEYFAFPQRFLFVEVSGLGPAFAACAGNAFELAILFSRHVPALEGAVEPDQFQLHCTPAINLFERRADRLQLDDSSHAYHVVPDRTATADYEVFDVRQVAGQLESGEEMQFLPLFATPHEEPTAPHGYYSVAREPRLPSARTKRDGPRSGYVATETFLSLVDPHEAPFRAGLRQIAARIGCTNRDLPLFMPVGEGQAGLTFGGSTPLEAVRVVAGPSRPQSAMREGGIAWRLLGLLSLNYLSLLDSDMDRGAIALRERLTIFAHGAEAGLRRQIEGIRSVAVKPVVRRHPAVGPIAFSRGLEIRVTVDDLSFEGGSAVLLASVLHRYFTLHASMNSFAQTVLASLTRGEVVRWTPGLGARAVL